MIGQGGKTVRPRLYIGVGISGMSHHVVGMDESEFVVAINQDPKLNSSSSPTSQWWVIIGGLFLYYWTNSGG